jgi:hypothetical protein
MLRAVLAAVLLPLVGCQTAPQAVPREQIPPPFLAHGATIAIADERHDWERQPMNGTTTLYRIGRVMPNPWSQLAQETEAIVAALPEKPQRVDVIVTSFRLVRKENKPSIHDPSDNVRIGRQSVAGLNEPHNGMAYEQLKSATQSGDQRAAAAAGNQLLFQNGQPSFGVQSQTAEPEDVLGSLVEHPPGASCRLRAAVRLTYADGREILVDVRAIAAGQNTTGSQYQGEALEFAAKMAIRQYATQLRRDLGLPES